MIDFPSSPTVGQVVSSPSGTSWRWTGSTWLLGTAASAGGARGTVAYGQATASQGPVTALTPITGLSATWTASPNRTYRITVRTNLIVKTATDVGLVYITTGAGAEVQRHYTGAASMADDGFGVTVVAVLSGLSGAVTYIAQMNKLYGGAGVIAQSSPLSPSFILVEDITYDAGPGGAAARVATGGTAFPWAGVVPASTSLLTQTGVFNGVTTSGGLVTVPWPVAFTTQVVSFFTQSITLAGYYIPVNRAAITLTGVQLVAFNVNGTVVASGAIDLAYTVTGW